MFKRSGSDAHTFSLSGLDWPLTDSVRCYLEWFAIDANDFRYDGLHEDLYWEDGELFLNLPETTDDDPLVISPESAIPSIVGDSNDEHVWGWIIGCGLTKWPPSDIDPDLRTVAATQTRITQRVVWKLGCGLPVSDDLREQAKFVLGQYTEAEWAASIDEDPALSDVKSELGL